MNGDEHHLIERCLADDSHAQYELYQRFAPKMYSICLRYCPSRELAQEALQDGFIRVFRNLNQFRFECPLEFWMRRIFINTSIRLSQKELRHADSSIESFFQVSNSSTAPSHNHDLEVIQRAIERLPLGFRTVFYLYAIDGFSHKEIAKLLGISEGTSKSQYARARKRLQDELRLLYPEFSSES